MEDNVKQRIFAIIKELENNIEDHVFAFINTQSIILIFVPTLLMLIFMPTNTSLLYLEIIPPILVTGEDIASYLGTFFFEYQDACNKSVVDIECMKFNQNGESTVFIQNHDKETLTNLNFYHLMETTIIHIMIGYKIQDKFNISVYSQLPYFYNTSVFLIQKAVEEKGFIRFNSSRDSPIVIIPKALTYHDLWNHFLDFDLASFQSILGLQRVKPDRSKPILLLNRKRNRFVVNLKNISESLGEKGDYVNDTADLDFRNTMGFINSKMALISPHGAQLTNMLFMQQCSIVIELTFPGIAGDDHL